MWFSVLRVPCTFILFAIGFVHAQTITTTDNLGETIIEVVSTNLALGVLTTQTLQTLPPAAAAQNTITTTDNLGNSIVEVLSTNAQGVVVTRTLQTLAPAAANTALQPIRTITTTDNLGESIVEVVASNPALGVLTTQVIRTLVPQGPVGQPAATNPGQTIYFYTTTNANGQPTEIMATFTPTYQAATGPPYVAPSNGTVLNYSQWLSMVGTNTGTPSAATSRAGPRLLSDALKCSAAAILALVCGGLLVLP